ncbi:antirestriction protein [Psychrobacillus phage Perkons]|nr:antirestriction protein [Psychrobacillus phage Perkons]
MTEKLYVNVWIGNLGKYNEGELVGEWFTLPCDMEEVSKAIGLNEEYEEYQINDFETNITGLEIHHYENIGNLNTMMEELEELNEDQQLAYMGWLELNPTIKHSDCIEVARNEEYSILRETKNMFDVAWEKVNEEGYFGYDLPSELLNHIDYNSLGETLDSCGTYIFLENDICIEFFH